MELERKLFRLGFQKLAPEAGPVFRKYYGQMKGNWASFTSFVSMIGWNHSDRVYYRVIGPYLVCVAWEFTGQRLVLLPFFGDYVQEEIDRTFREAEKLFETLQAPLVMTDMREWMIPWYLAVPDTKWEVINDRDFSDYIYRKEDFLAAMDTQKTRYNYRYFLRKYDPETVLLTPESEADCMKVLEEVWCSAHPCEECDCGCQKKTLANVLSSLEETGAKGILVRAQGENAAYCIVMAEHGVGTFHFMKVKRGLRGLNEYIHRECCERFLQDVDLINYTEDMGVEGLRKHKNRLAPYTLEPNCELRIRRGRK